MAAQCLSNAMWAAARLHLRGNNVGVFLGLCMRELSTERQLAVFTPQGLANVLWALAELRFAGVGLGMQDALAEAAAVQGTLTAVAATASSRLSYFMPQELSMVAWAHAKLYGRGPLERGNAKNRASGQASRLPVDVQNLLLALASESHRRLSELSPQSISNIAWALATLDLVGPRALACLPQGLTVVIGRDDNAANTPEQNLAREFLRASLVSAAKQIPDYSPQAVANLMWAAVRLEAHHVKGGTSVPDEGEVTHEVGRFCAIAAKEATLRMLEFAWRDLAGVAVALAHGHYHSPEGITFMTLLMGHTAAHCRELSPQMMLNIAQSAARLQISRDAMQQMVDGIAASIEARNLRLNEVDHRQWKFVQAWCPPQIQPPMMAPTMPSAIMTHGVPHMSQAF